MDRRAFLRGMLPLLAAPAVIPIRSLMPLRGVILRPYTLTWHQKIAGGPWNVMRRDFWSADAEAGFAGLRLLNSSIAFERDIFGAVATTGYSLEAS